MLYTRAICVLAAILSMGVEAKKGPRVRYYSEPKCKYMYGDVVGKQYPNCTVQFEDEKTLKLSTIQLPESSLVPIFRKGEKAAAKREGETCFVDCTIDSVYEYESGNEPPNGMYTVIFDDDKEQLHYFRAKEVNCGICNGTGKNRGRPCDSPICGTGKVSSLRRPVDAERQRKAAALDAERQRKAALDAERLQKARRETFQQRSNTSKITSTITSAGAKWKNRLEQQEKRKRKLAKRKIQEERMKAAAIEQMTVTKPDPIYYSVMGEKNRWAKKNPLKGDGFGEDDKGDEYL